MEKLMAKMADVIGNEENVKNDNEEMGGTGNSKILSQKEIARLTNAERKKLMSELMAYARSCKRPKKTNIVKEETEKTVCCTTTDIVKQYSEIYMTPMITVKKIVENFFELVRKNVAKGRAVTLQGLVSFKPKLVEMKNPNEKQIATPPERFYKLYVSAAKQMKESAKTTQYQRDIIAKRARKANKRKMDKLQEKILNARNQVEIAKKISELELEKFRKMQIETQTMSQDSNDIEKEIREMNGTLE